MKTSEKISYVIAILFAVLGTFFLVRAKAHADIFFPEDRHFFTLEAALTPREKEYYQNKRDFHLENGLRTYNDAKEKCWYLPRMEERTKARTCYTTAVTVIGTPTVQAKLVVTVTQLLISYGLSAMDEWDYINDKLYWSKYHMELYEFYKDLLDKA
jgi:hypothetical protein